MAAIVVAPKASRLERNTMDSCFFASQISTRRNSTGSSPSRFNRGKQIIWSRTTLQFCGTCTSSFTSYTALSFIRVTKYTCLLYTSDAADDLTRVDLGGRRLIKKK